VVLADGTQAAFAAASVAELSRAGVWWSVGRGAGLGAQVAVLAVLGEAAEAERRWQRQAALGCPLLRSRLARLQESVGTEEGVVVSADAWSLPGWLDPDVLREHLAPEMGGLPGRLRRAGVRCSVAVTRLDAGTTEWAELADLPPESATSALVASASFPGGWGAVETTGKTGVTVLWGGCAAAAQHLEVEHEAIGWDLVCGFPVPAAARPALGRSLLELVQRRDEAAAAAAVERWLRGRRGGNVRLLAPTVEAYRDWSARDGADLGVEYPLPWERNGELLAQVLSFARAAVRLVLAG
jgi:hypothetical protein